MHHKQNAESICGSNNKKVKLLKVMQETDLQGLKLGAIKNRAQCDG